MSLTKNDINTIRTVVKDSIKGLESEVKLIRIVQGEQSIMIRTLQTAVNGLNSSYRTQSVLFEDLNDQFTTVAEMAEDSLGLRTQVRDHEVRLNEVESEQKLLKTTVAEHSRKLKKLK
jgi:hypothetical protein